MKYLYLVLSILGIIFPYTQFIPFSNEFGFDVELMIKQATVNYISTGIAIDAFFTALVFIIFILFEQKKRPIKHVWAPIVGMFAVGLSFGVPFYLFLRTISMENKK